MLAGYGRGGSVLVLFSLCFALAAGRGLERTETFYRYVSPDTLPLAVFVALLLAICLYAARCGLETLLRAGLALLVLTAASLALVLAGNAGQMRLENLQLPRQPLQLAWESLAAGFSVAPELLLLGIFAHSAPQSRPVSLLGRAPDGSGGSGSGAGLRRGAGLGAVRGAAGAAAAHLGPHRQPVGVPASGRGPCVGVAAGGGFPHGAALCRSGGDPAPATAGKVPAAVGLAGGGAGAGRGSGGILSARMAADGGPDGFGAGGGLRAAYVSAKEEKTMGKRGRLLAAVLALAGLTGCGAPALGDRAIVKAIFVDRQEQYQVGLAVLEEGEGEKGAQTTDLQLYTGSGDTLAQALRQAEPASTRRPFYAQNQLLWVGRQAAEQQLPEVLDYFAAEQASRPNMAVYVAELDLEELEQLAGEEGLQEGRPAAGKQPVPGRLRPHDLRSAAGPAGGRGLVPLLEPGESGLTVQGLALYRSQALSGLLEGQQAASAGLFLGQKESMEWIEETDLGQLRLRLDSPAVQRQIRTENGQPVLQLVLRGTVRDLSAADPSLQQQAAGWQSREELSRKISQSVTGQLQQLVDQCWQPEGDPFQLGWWFGAWDTRWYYDALDSGSLYQPGRIEAWAEIRVM